MVLPQVLYGSEFRSLSAQALQAVRKQGLMVIPPSALLRLSYYQAAEVVGGLSLGDSSVRAVAEEALSRRLQWLLVMANQPDLVGTVDRFLATLDGPSWVEPTPAIASAVASPHW